MVEDLLCNICGLRLHPPSAPAAASTSSALSHHRLCPILHIGRNSHFLLHFPLTPLSSSLLALPSREPTPNVHCMHALDPPSADVAPPIEQSGPSPSGSRNVTFSFPSNRTLPPSCQRQTAKRQWIASPAKNKVIQPPSVPEAVCSLTRHPLTGFAREAYGISIM